MTILGNNKSCILSIGDILFSDEGTFNPYEVFRLFGGLIVTIHMSWKNGKSVVKGWVVWCAVELWLESGWRLTMCDAICVFYFIFNIKTKSRDCHCQCNYATTALTHCPNFIPSNSHTSILWTYEYLKICYIWFLRSAIIR